MPRSDEFFVCFVYGGYPQAVLNLELDLTVLYCSFWLLLIFSVIISQPKMCLTANCNADFDRGFRRFHQRRLKEEGVRKKSGINAGEGVLSV